MESYVHLLSPIRKATNGVTNFFDMKLQNSEKGAVRLVSYSPEKRQELLQFQQTNSPINIVGLSKNPSKRFSSEDDDYTIPNKAKVSRISLDFESNESFSNRFHNVRQALAANVYETIDLKVKVMMKSENKQPIIKAGKTNTSWMQQLQMKLAQ